MKTIAVDLGFGYIKVFGDIATFKIPSVVGEGTSRTFGGFTHNNSLDDRLKNLHTKIDDNEWFIGDLAVRQESGDLIYDENRLNNEETKAALLSLLAMINDDRGSSSSYILFTGLPISHFKNKDLRNSYKESLLGSHRITLLDKETPITKEVKIEKVEVYPQGIGAFFNMVLKNNGSINEKFEQGSYAVLDQGYRTLDYAVFNSKFEMIENKSDTKEKGMGVKDLLNELLSKLKQRYGKESYHLTEIDMISAFETRSVFIGGKKIMLDREIEQLYQKQAKKIINSLGPIWGDFNFHTIYLAGGIARHLEQYLKQYLSGKNIVLAKGEKDSQFANAEGFYKFGKRKYEPAVKE